MRIVLAAAASLLVAGCGTYNPLRWVGLVDPPSNDPTKLTEIKATVVPRAAWSTDVGKSGGFRFRPVVVGGRVYAASADGMVTLLDEGNGKVVSRFDAKKRDRKSTRLNSSHIQKSRMPSSA